MSLKNVFNRRNRILLKELVITDFKLRYQGSTLGYLWSLLKPMFLFAILYVVFVKFLKFGDGIEHYPIYLLLGIVLWNFFVEGTSQGMASIVSRGDVIRKINFPKYIVVVSGTISALINLVFSFSVVFAFMIINGVEIRPSIAWLPLIVLEMYIFSLAIAFLLSALYVKYRDIGYIWEIILQGAFYATPILYPVSLILNENATAAKVLMLSPVAQAIQSARYNVVTEQAITTSQIIASPLLRAVPYIIVVISILLATIYFKRSSKYFAENI